MKLKKINGNLYLTDLDSFNLRDIFECGQAFRFQREEDGSYTAIHRGRVINLKEEDDKVLLKNTDEDEFKEIWWDYFDLSTDYGEIKKNFSVDPIMKEAISYGEGIRILKQDYFETLISFIVSANNQIPRIKKIIEEISKKYGRKIEVKDDFAGSDRDFYSFPSPEELSLCTPDELRNEIKTGFRAERIWEAANKVRKGDFDVDSIADLSYEDGKEVLMSLNGVGPKVANCVLLFGYNKTTAFPVDVWVKRIMEDLYFKKDTPNKTIEAFGKEKFGDLSGYAQQYLFYYARER